MDVFYARVSTSDQSLDLQLDAAERAGCGKVFTDTISGAKSSRPDSTSASPFYGQATA